MLHVKPAGLPLFCSCDCFLLKDILNNWSDGACVKLLNNLHLAMRQGDKIIVMERVMHTADFAEERVGVNYFVIATF